MLPNNGLSWKKFVVKPPWRSYGYQFKNENGFLRDLESLRIKKEQKRPDLAMHLRQFRLQYIPEISKGDRAGFDYSFRAISSHIEKKELLVRNSINKNQIPEEFLNDVKQLETSFKDKSNLYKVYLQKRNQELNMNKEKVSFAGGRMAMIADEFRNLSQEESETFKDKVNTDYKNKFSELQEKWDDAGWYIPDFLHPNIMSDSIAAIASHRLWHNVLKERENRFEQEMTEAEKASAKRRASEMKKINTQKRTEIRELRKKYNFGTKQFLDTPYRLYVKRMRKLHGTKTKILKQTENWEDDLRQGELLRIKEESRQLKIRYDMQLKIAIKSALKNKDWGALSAKEVKEYGQGFIDPQISEPEDVISFNEYHKQDQALRNKFSEAKVEDEKINFPTFRRDFTKKRIPQSFFIYKMKEMRNRQLEKRKFYGFHPDLHFRQTPLNLFIAAKKVENPKLCFRELLKESERWRDSEIGDDLIIASQRQKELFDIENKHATRKVVIAKDWIALKPNELIEYGFEEFEEVYENAKNIIEERLKDEYAKLSS